MMDATVVQIVENHADITGTLIGVAAASDRPGFRVLTVRVEATQPVAGSPDFFVADIGRTITLLARADGRAAAMPPGPLTLRVRKASPATSFVEE